jgi:hypothetical protein
MGFMDLSTRQLVDTYFTIREVPYCRKYYQPWVPVLRGKVAGMPSGFKQAPAPFRFPR